MEYILNFIVDILKIPSILVGVMAMLGLLFQKKPFTDVVKGTVKTILGFIVLGGGAGVLVGALSPMGAMFEQGFNVQGIVPNNEAIVSMALKEYGTITALIMALGMFFNIFIARFTKLKYIVYSFVAKQLLLSSRISSCDSFIIFFMKFFTILKLN